MSQRDSGRRGYDYDYQQARPQRYTGERQGYGQPYQANPYYDAQPAYSRTPRQAAYAQQQGGYQQYARPGAYQEKKQRGRGAGSMVVAGLVGLLLGALAMFIVSLVTPNVPSAVDTTLKSNQLNTVVGTYRYAGEVYEITAQEAILGSVSLDTMRNEDGTYNAPSADMVLSYARNQILAQLVADNGITVTADEVANYALSIVGTSDTASVAAYFGMDQDQSYSILTQAASVKKLRERVTAGSAAAPVPPTPPADGNTEVGNAAYADYIIGLLGPYWDAATGTWADTNNAFYTALKDQVFAAGSANYNAAQIAYTVAYEQFTAGNDTADAWTAYLNGYLGDAAISIATLKA